MVNSSTKASTNIFWGDNYFDCLILMTKKELKLKYRNFKAAIFWILINPLIQMVVVGIIFSRFVNIPNYFLFIYSGLLLWGVFSHITSRTVVCFVNERHLLQKSNFPREILLLSVILSDLLQIAVATALIFIYLFILGQINNFSIIWLSLSLIWMFVFTFGISMMLSVMNVRFRQVNQIIQNALIIWFYATPIIYPSSMIPNNYQWLFLINPVTSIVGTYRLAIFGSMDLTGNILVFNLVITILIFWLGLILFNKYKKTLVDWL
jgi:ABC-type polysaccharide/polyol phosphate export permease